MKDKIRFDYVEAQVEITCVICSNVFLAFPDLENRTVYCLKCNRAFKFNFSMEPINNNVLIKKILQEEKPLINFKNTEEL